MAIQMTMQHHTVFYRSRICWHDRSIQADLLIQNLLSEIRFNIKSIPLLVDNQGAMFVASNPAQEGHTKHIEISEHYICECIQKEKVKLFYIPTNEQRADIFTKNPTWQHFEENRKSLSLSRYTS